MGAKTHPVQENKRRESRARSHLVGANQFKLPPPTANDNNKYGSKDPPYYSGEQEDPPRIGEQGATWWEQTSCWQELPPPTANPPNLTTVIHTHPNPVSMMIMNLRRKTLTIWTIEWRTLFSLLEILNFEERIFTNFVLNGILQMVRLTKERRLSFEI